MTRLLSALCLVSLLAGCSAFDSATYSSDNLAETLQNLHPMHRR